MKQTYIKAVRRAMRELLAGISREEQRHIYRFAKATTKGRKHRILCFWYNVATMGEKTPKGFNRFDVYSIIEAYYTEKNYAKKYTMLFLDRLNQADKIGYFFGNLKKNDIRRMA